MRWNQENSAIALMNLNAWNSILGLNPNGMKLSFNRLPSQLTAQFVSWLDHEGERFHPPSKRTVAGSSPAGYAKNVR